MAPLYQLRLGHQNQADKRDLALFGIVRNISSADWTSEHTIGVRHAVDEHGRCFQLQTEFRASVLAGDRSAGGASVFKILIPGSHLPEHCETLHVDVVNEGHHWLSDISGAPASFNLTGQAISPENALRDVDAKLFHSFGTALASSGQLVDAIDWLCQAHRLDPDMDTLSEIRELIAAQLNPAPQIMTADGLTDTMRQIMLSGFFDPAWYLKRYGDLNPRFSGPLQHFAESGGFEWRSPGPHFDTEWYMLQNPDLIPDVVRRDVHPLLHYLNHGQHEGRSAAPPTGTMIKAVSNLLDDVMDLDPKFYATHDFDQIKSLPVANLVQATKSFRAFKRVFESIPKPYDYVIAVPWLVHGGADLMALNMARAITSVHGPRSVLILAVDHPRTDAMDWLPPDIDFLSLQPDGDLSTVEATEALLYFLQAAAPKCLINVNSMATWELFRVHGNALSRRLRMYGCAFCRDHNKLGRPAGYSDTHVGETLPFLTGLISDNSVFFRTLVDQFGVPPSLQGRFIALYNPPPSPVGWAKSETASVSVPDHYPAGFRVLWASRLTRQKNLELLQKIIKAAPDIIFDVWGRGEADQMLRDAGRSSVNLNVMGPYNRFDQLPLRQYGAFLYTSYWDGIPNVLLEAASADLPIVTSSVGGISELVTDASGWSIDNLSDPAPYVSALRTIRDDWGLAARRRLNMQRLLSTRHGWDKFVGDMKHTGIIREVSCDA